MKYFNLQTSSLVSLLALSACDGLVTPAALVQDRRAAGPRQQSVPLAQGVDLIEVKRRVDLTLDAEHAAASAPFKVGVPFPKGALRSVRDLRLDDETGANEVAAQFSPLAEWPDGSIKSVLVQLIADSGPAPTGYRLSYGQGVTSSAPANGVTVVQGPTTTIETGVLQIRLDSRGMLETLHRDLDGDGDYGLSEQILHGGDIFAVNALDDQTYLASLASDAAIVVEEEGPIRAVIRASGSLTRQGGDQLVRYIVRYYIYLETGKLDVELTLEDDRLENNVRDVDNGRAELALSISSYGLRLQSSQPGAADYRFGSEAGGAHGGVVSGEHYLLQEGTFTYDDGQDLGHTFQYSGAGSGDRAPGWMTLDGPGESAPHVGVLVKDFWQQFPGELNIDGSQLTVVMHPERAISGAPDTAPPVQGVNGTKVYARPNTFYFEREGGAKTYQMRLLFPEARATTAAMHSENALFQSHDQVLRADPAWYTASGVFGDLDQGSDPDGATGFNAHMMQGVYARSMAEDQPATNFGWRDHGGRMRGGWSDVVNGVRIPGFYNDTHVGANNFFRMYVRTGDQRWFSLAELSTRHFMDIDVSHGPRQGYWNTGGAPQPPGEIHAIKHDMRDHTARNVHLGHAHVSGLSDYYLLTGDKRGLEVLAKIGEWWEFMTPHLFPLPFDFDEDYREATRDYGWPLYVMNEYTRVFGDAGYHQSVSAHLVEYMIQWWQTPRERIGFDAETGMNSNVPEGKFNDASQGTGFWTMTRAGNYGNYPASNGCSPWMAGSLLSNLIEFRELDAEFALEGLGSNVDQGLLLEMLFQTMNSLVRNAYDVARGYWVYSEAVRVYTGGDQHLIYPLAYLDRLYGKELAAGNVANPQWYETRPTWSRLAEAAFMKLQQQSAVSPSQAYGWYGYEIIYPLDFFKIMNEGY